MEAFIERLKSDPAAALAGVDRATLEAFLALANDRYFNSGDPVVPDAVYDLAALHHRDKYPDSKAVPTPAASAESVKVKLPTYAGSLDKFCSWNEKDVRDLAAWRHEHEGVRHVLSVKLDGVSGLLEATPGKPARVMSRGDGRFGQDVTRLAAAMASFPTPPPEAGHVVVRGEFIIRTDGQRTMGRK